jgi:predicted ester cyclase
VASNGATPYLVGGAQRNATGSVDRVMPKDFSIAFEIGNGATKPGVERGPRKHSMKGFEDTYVDIVDYIIRITHRIWEDQDVGYIYDTYSPSCRVYDDGGPRHGIEQMVAGTIQRINAFPDMRHYADEVIWAGNDEQGFVTSHRALNIGYHTGHWRWGPPTGRKVNSWVIANCVIGDNEIYEEWVLYNLAAQLSQLGIDVAAAAKAHGNADALAPLTEREITEVHRLQGGQKPLPYPPYEGRGFSVDHFIRQLFHDTFNRRDLSAIDRAYAPNVRWYGTTNRTGYGRSDVRAMARSLLATFPDLGLQVDEVYWMGNDDEGYRVSVRWTALGTHRGWSLYGDPTGRRVHIWGLQQMYIERGEIVEDWMLFNEFDVLAQLLKDDPAPLIS